MNEEQAEQWEAEAGEQRAAGRALYRDGEPRDACIGIDQEFGWDIEAELAEAVGFSSPPSG
jgi:hypothetical protein